MSLVGHLGFVHQVRFDATGERLVSASVEGSIAWWNVAARRLVRRTDAHTGPINGLRWHADTLASVGHDGGLCVTGQDGVLQREQMFDEPLHAVAWASTGLVVGAQSGALHFVVGDDVRTVPAAHAGAIEALLANDVRVVTGGRDGVVSVWSADTGQLQARFEGHGDWVTRLAFSDDKHVVSVGEDGCLIVWDVDAGREQWRLELGDPIWGLALDRGANRAVVGPGGTPLVIDLQTRAIQAIDGVAGFAARAIDIAPTGVICLGDDGGALHFVAPGDTAPFWSIAGANRGVLTASALETGVVTGHQDGSVSLIGAHARSASSAHGFMAYTSAALDRERVATAAFDGSIRIWNDALRPTAQLEHGGHVFALGYARDADVLLSAGEDRWIEWDARTARLRHAERNIGTGVHTLADIDRTGRVVAAVGENARLMVWHERRLVASWPLPYQDSSAVAMLPDGSRALVAFNDGVVGLVSLDDGAFTELYDDHDSWVRQLLVTDDGQFVVSCSQNGIGVAYDLSSSSRRRLTTAPLAAIALERDASVKLVLADGTLAEFGLAANY